MPRQADMLPREKMVLELPVSVWNPEVMDTAWTHYFARRLPVSGYPPADPESCHALFGLQYWSRSRFSGHTQDDRHYSALECQAKGSAGDRWTVSMVACLLFLTYTWRLCFYHLRESRLTTWSDSTARCVKTAAPCPMKPKLTAQLTAVHVLIGDMSEPKSGSVEIYKSRILPVTRLEVLIATRHSSMTVGLSESKSAHHYEAHELSLLLALLVVQQEHRRGSQRKREAAK